MKGGSGLLSNQPYIYAGVRSPARRSSFEGHVLAPGDSIWFEGSASIHRYGGPIMRRSSDSAPPPAVRRTHDIMVRALDATLASARPGVTSGEVDRAARRIVEDAGLGER